MNIYIYVNIYIYINIMCFYKVCCKSFGFAQSTVTPALVRATCVQP